MKCKYYLDEIDRETSGKASCVCDRASLHQARKIANLQAELDSIKSMLIWTRFVEVNFLFVRINWTAVVKFSIIGYLPSQ